MQLEFTAVFKEAPEGGYVAFVEELPGANTQGETLDEARDILREAVGLVLASNQDQCRPRQFCVTHVFFASFWNGTASISNDKIRTARLSQRTSAA